MVPLHVHSCYSLLDSSSTFEQLFEHCHQSKYPALGLTDRDGLYGSIKFYKEAFEHGILPILGSELTLDDGTHLTLLIQDRTGYANLCRLLSSRVSSPNGISKQFVAEHSNGLIALSGCQRAAIPQLLLQGKQAEARRLALWYAEVFPSRFWLELQSHGLPHEKSLSRSLIQVSRTLGIPCVAAVNSHYTKPDDRIVYEALCCIKTQTSLKQPHSDKHLSGAFHLPSPAELKNLFREHPESLLNTDRIAESCHLELTLGKPVFPDFPTPDSQPPSEYLRTLCLKGAKKRYGDINSTVTKRLEHELTTVEELGYTAYFLIVWDITREARKRGIRAVARGSAADSLVCYTLGISHVCPLKYGLYFERFLNKERVKKSGLADIDLDIQWDRRDELVQYVYHHYGAEHTAIIGSFNTFQARSAVADVAKAFALSEKEARRLARQARSVEWSTEPHKTIVDVAHRIEGIPRHLGMHPCGVVISQGRLDEMLPLETSAKGCVITQYDMDCVEDLGLVKMDILGQAGLTVISDTVTSVARNHEKTIDIYTIPKRDAQTWKLISQGETRGCFQIESPAMCNLLRRLKCRDFECLIASLSLIRPGAANQNKVEHYSKRHAGLEPADFVHPSVRPALEDTYGLMVYEEHILMVAHLFAGMDLGRADLLRRALVKQSDRAKASGFEEEFRGLAFQKGRTPEEINKVWQLLLDFCGYSFNKAHSSSYAVLAYQAAYLKSHFPAEFMTAVLTSGKGFYSRLTYVLESRRIGIPVEGPNVNRSHQDFVAVDGRIQVPLSQIQALPQRLLSRIQRAKKPFLGFDDFISKIQPGISDLENLIKCGACDSLGQHRPVLLWKSRQLGFRKNRENSSPVTNQGSLLFSDTTSAPEKSLTSKSADGNLPVRDYSLATKIRDEMHILGFPISGHPLDAFSSELSSRDCCAIADMCRSKGTVTICGIIVAERVHRTQEGQWMKFITLSDRTGMAEIVLFPETFRKYARLASLETLVIISGTVQRYEHKGVGTLIADTVQHLGGFPS